MNFLENITFRRTRTKSDSILNDSEVTGTMLNETVTSVPEMSDDDDNEIKTLRDQITNLTLDLQSAHLEIEQLTLENNNLKTMNVNLSKQNELYKKVTCSPVKLKSPSTKKAKNLNKNHTHMQTETLKLGENNNKTPVIKNNASPIRVEGSDKLKLTPPINQCINNVGENKSKRNKIYVISTDNKNKLLHIAENTFEKYELCHYIKPSGTIKLLLEGIKDKLSEFTLQDFCIILIGEEDFKMTNKYFDSILLIRQILQEVSNTNIIIGTPTYKFYTNNYLYNSRVETFNNLLYLDTITHGHAYFLDSNLNLKYDDTMFNKRTGVINYNGMQSIFNDIFKMTIDIQSSITDFYQPDNQMETVTASEETGQFFLQSY